MAEMSAVQYILDANGNTIGAIVPIALWNEIASERETAYLLKSEAMKQRLTAAMQRTGGTSIEDTRAKLGI